MIQQPIPTLKKMVSFSSRFICLSDNSTKAWKDTDTTCHIEGPQTQTYGPQRSGPGGNANSSINMGSGHNVSTNGAPIVNYGDMDFGDEDPETGDANGGDGGDNEEEGADQSESEENEADPDFEGSGDPDQTADPSNSGGGFEFAPSIPIPV
jgi:hypothetical protein